MLTCISQKTKSGVELDLKYCLVNISVDVLDLSHKKKKIAQVHLSESSLDSILQSTSDIRIRFDAHTNIKLL